MAHTDGPAYQDCIAIISLRSSVLFRFIPRDSIERCPVETLLLQPNSMLVFTRAATVEYLHDIPEALEDFVDDRVVNCSSAGVSAGDAVPRADTRVSITIRRALYPVSDSGTLCAVSALAQTSPAGSEGPTVDDAVSSWECSVCSPSIRITRCIGELLLSSVPSATGADAAAAFLSVPVDSLAGYTFRVPPGGVLLPEGVSSVQAGSLTSISCAVHISSGTDCIVFIPSFSSLPTHTPIELTVYW